MDGNKTKDLDHVEAGLKGYASKSPCTRCPKHDLTDERYSAMHNENLSEEAQFAAAAKLGEIKK